MRRRYPGLRVSRASALGPRARRTSVTSERSLAAAAAGGRPSHILLTSTSAETGRLASRSRAAHSARRRLDKGTGRSPTVNSRGPSSLAVRTSERMARA